MLDAKCDAYIIIRTEVYPILAVVVWNWPTVLQRSGLVRLALKVITSGQTAAGLIQVLTAMKGNLLSMVPRNTISGTSGA